MAKKQNQPKQKVTTNPNPFGEAAEKSKVLTPKAEPKIKEIKVAKKPVERLSGDHMVNFCSNGLSRYIRKAGKIHVVTADHAQVLIDKGYGHVV